MPKDVIDQLIDVYYNEEWWHKKKLSQESARRYFKNIIDKGNLFYHTDDSGELLGYVEFWMVNLEQLNRILNDEPFPAETENVTDGNICYVANYWIKREYRNNGVHKCLEYKFFPATRHCQFYAGEESGRGDRLRIYRRKHG